MAVDLIPIPAEIAEDLKEDLAVLNDDKIEDLKSSPFITTPKTKPKKTFKPPPPQPEPEPEPIEEPEVLEEKQIMEPRKKPKKELSEKQKAHLAKMRQRRIDKANEKIDKIQNNTQVNVGMVKPVIESENIEYMEAKEFNAWLNNMSKFEKLIKKKKAEEQKRIDAEQKKEMEIEQRIRKKIQMENLQKQGLKEPVPEPPQILQQEQKPDYGEFSSMFGY